MKMLKILKLAFVIIFTLQIGATAILITTPEKVSAAADPVPLDYQSQIQIPVTGSGFDQTSTKVGNYDSKTGVMTSNLLAKYIQTIYTYGLMIAGILAAIVLMGGGLIWLTSAGNDSKITQAKELISGSVVGLIILFGSWVLLNTINPDLLKLKTINTSVVVKTSLPDPYDLTSGSSQDNPIVCCEQLNTNNELLFCAQATSNKCDKASRNDVTQIRQVPGDCNSISACTSLTNSCLDQTKSPAENLPDGTKCKNNEGYCYGGNCYTGDGTAGSPCGAGVFKATCSTQGNLTGCNSGFSRVYGGRDCGSSTYCCMPDGGNGDPCGLAENHAVCQSGWAQCDSGYEGSTGGRNCKSGFWCCQKILYND